MSKDEVIEQLETLKTEIRYNFKRKNCNIATILERVNAIQELINTGLTNKHELMIKTKIAR